MFGLGKRRKHAPNLQTMTVDWDRPLSAGRQVRVFMTSDWPDAELRSSVSRRLADTSGSVFDMSIDEGAFGETKHTLPRDNTLLLQEISRRIGACDVVIAPAAPTDAPSAIWELEQTAQFNKLLLLVTHDAEAPANAPHAAVESLRRTYATAEEVAAALYALLDNHAA